MILFPPRGKRRQIISARSYNVNEIRYPRGDILVSRDRSKNDSFLRRKTSGTPTRTPGREPRGKSHAVRAVLRLNLIYALTSAVRHIVLHSAVRTGAMDVPPRKYDRRRRERKSFVENVDMTTSITRSVENPSDVYL